MPPVNGRRIGAIHRRILGWYSREGRSFLWRRTTDPYTILISEIMLQQTQASRVEEKMPAFLIKFPTLRSLAESSKGDVIRAWRGLGYNNRAARLHDLARAVVNGGAGQLPDDPLRLEELPGIGRYTANAIASFAFRRRLPVVEVNVQRLFSRMFWRMKTPAGRKDPATIWATAERMLPADAWSWNQSIMELGATICTASTPVCSRCPVTRYCLSSHLEKSATSRRYVKARGAHPERGIPGTKREPAYGGIPRRLWRGRVVEALRNVDAGRSMTVADLGKTIKPGFRANELSWLNGLVRRLADDGIVRTLRTAGTVRVALSAE